MGNYGYHWTPCPGGKTGGGAIAVAVLVLLAICSGAVPAALSALAIALIAVASLMVLSAAAAIFLVWRRSRRSAATWMPVSAAPARETLTATVTPQVTEPERPAIPQVVNFNFYGADAARASAVIRQALPAQEERS
jgi:hypothetical protein